MEYIINHISELPSVLTYGVLFIGFALESNAVLFASALLVQQGAFHFIYFIPVAFFGSLIGDAFFYSLGSIKLDWKILRHYRRMADFLAKPFDHHLVEHTIVTIILSKFVYALNCAISIRAGQTGFSFKKFMLVDALAILPWLIIIGGLGYASGGLISITFSDITHFELTLLAIIIVFFLIKHYLSDYIRNILKDKNEPISDSSEKISDAPEEAHTS